jgi:thiamine-monophosphate kinase
MAEFDLIARIAERARSRGDVRVGIGDDAALLAPSPGYWLATSCDVLNVGVHFRADDPPAAVGHKAAAVNLSDLAAMGAEPAWCVLGLSLPEADRRWLDGFLDGFLGLCAEHDMALVGGDTSRGPLSLAVTVTGLVPAGEGLRRVGARAGDDLWVTGTLGDAAAALQQGATADPYLLSRLQRPTPRVRAGSALLRRARAAIDLSDGLVGDLGHVLAANRVGAEIELASLPTSRALREAVPEAAARWALQVAGGDDYELLFAADPQERRAIERVVEETGTPVCRIGRFRAEPGLRLWRPDGERWEPPQAAWQHFASPA